MRDYVVHTEQNARYTNITARSNLVPCVFPSFFPSFLAVNTDRASAAGNSYHAHHVATNVEHYHFEMQVLEDHQSRKILVRGAERLNSHWSTFFRRNMERRSSVLKLVCRNFARLTYEVPASNAIMLSEAHQWDWSRRTGLQKIFVLRFAWTNTKRRKGK